MTSGRTVYQSASSAGRLVRFAVLVALAWWTSTAAGCGGVRTAGGVEAGIKANDAFLVAVTDGMPPHPVRLVSVSVVEASREGDLPATLPDDELDTMRAEAGRRGAETLLLERIDTRHRKAFYGLGLLRDREAADESRRGLTPPLCSHARISSATGTARKRAERCLADLKGARPSLQGTVIVSFLVDPFGDVYQAGPMPASSKDSQALACGYEAVHAVSWGQHPELLCRATVEASL